MLERPSPYDEQCCGESQPFKPSSAATDLHHCRCQVVRHDILLLASHLAGQQYHASPLAEKGRCGDGYVSISSRICSALMSTCDVSDP